MTRARSKLSCQAIHLKAKKNRNWYDTKKVDAKIYETLLYHETILKSPLINALFFGFEI